MDGRKLGSGEQDRETLGAYLTSIPDETVDLMFLHSSRISIPLVENGRRKAMKAKQAEEHKPVSVHYNCTVKVPKSVALFALDNKRRQLEEFVRILANSDARQWREEQEGQPLKQAAEGGQETEQLPRDVHTD